MRSLRTTMLIVVLAALLSMGGITITSAQDEAEAPGPAAPGEPFAAFLSGSVSFEPLEAPTEECPMGVITITDASGPSTLGDLTMHSEHCPTPGAPSVPAGETTLATASGDVIAGTYFVDCLPVMPSAQAGEVISCTGRLLVTGGSGEFSEAAGSLRWDAYVWFPGSLEVQGWPWFSVLEGTISY
jgi:hypothetical protein